MFIEAIGICGILLGCNTIAEGLYQMYIITKVDR
jgi:hypothetical protein